MAKATCLMDGCENPVKAKGLCNKHYLRLRIHGDPLQVRGPGVCSEDGCEKPVHGHGRCKMHWWRAKHYGDPQWLGSGFVGLDTSRPYGLTAEERFLRHVTPGGPDECWEWGGARDQNGYGVFNIGEHRTMTAHRFAWERFRSLIPDVTPNVLHHCDNPPCVNWVTCLFLGTQADNVLDMTDKGRGANQFGPYT